MPKLNNLPRIVGFSLVTGAGILLQQGTAHTTVATDLATTHSANTSGTTHQVKSGVPGNHVEYLAKKYGVSHAQTPVSPNVKHSATSNDKTPASKPDATKGTTSDPTKDASKSDSNNIGDNSNKGGSDSNASTTCKSSDAFSSVVYKVDGKVVSDLAGNVKQNSKVEVDFVIKQGCKDVKVGLAAYKAPSNVWDPAVADQQVLVAHDAGTFSADGKTHTLTVQAPGCDFQVDFVTGNVLNKLTADHNYSQPDGNLVTADNGGTGACDFTPPPPPPPPAPVCPTEVSKRVVGYTFTINGVKGFTTLAGNVKPGDIVEVDFTIAKGCSDQEISLASYDAPSGSFDPQTAAQQKLFDSKSGKFDAGEHSLAVKVPACYYQVDFVNGGVIEHLGPAGSDSFYGDKIIATDTGGKECVATVPTVPISSSSETTQTTVTTSTITTTSTVTTTTTTQQLARTGANTAELAALGTVLVLMGFAFNETAARMRRRTLAVTEVGQ